MRNALPARLQTMLARAEASPLGYNDVDRICALPFSEPMQYRCARWDEEPHLAKCPEHRTAACPGTDADAWSYVHLLAGPYDGGFRLWEPQCRAMRDWAQEGGLLAPIGVGWGKTLVTQWIANYDWVERITARQLLLVPSQVYEQTLRYAMPFARTHIPFGVPVIGLGGLSPARRRALAHRKKSALYVMPHSLLSTQDTEELLAQLDAETVIVDECHELVNHSAARAQRFARFMRAKPRRAAFLSGTITKKSVREYAPFLAFALGDRSPLPTSLRMANDWAAVLDAAAPRGVAATGPLDPLRSWARIHFPQERDQITEDRAGTRRAYRLRLNATPGVVSTGDADIGTGLRIVNLPCSAEPNGELAALLERLEVQGETPNGDPIEYPIHLFKWRYELITTGGYNEQVWPEAAQIAERWKIPLEEASVALEKAQGAHEVYKAYAGQLRDFIEATQAPGLDTPMLVGAHCHRHLQVGLPLAVPASLFQLWNEAREARSRATDDYGRIVERDKRFVRVDPARTEFAANVARHLHEASKKRGDNGSVVVWAYHRGFCAWLAEHLEAAGAAVLHCPAGEAEGAAIIERQGDGLIVVASITGHGTGKNLQGFGDTLFAQTPRQANVFEQALGRNHRGGQWRDELVVHTMLSSPFEDACYNAMLIDALYVQQTTGARQKAIMAGYDPMPKVVPGDVLRERGVPDARLLDAGTKRELLERFAEED